MAIPPPLTRGTNKADADHLQLLVVFHFVIAILALLGIGFVVLHFSFMRMFFDNPEIWKNQKGGPPPVEIFAIFRWFYAAAAGILLAAGVGNVLSGLFIRRRRHRMFSLVVAGLNCLQAPFGTVLGVFTFVVLLRDSVRETYEDV